MQLVITGRITVRAGLIKDRLKAYRYRQDVCWMERGEDGWGLMGAAYAVLYLFDGCSLGIPLMNAWRAGVPVIAVNGGLLQETAGGAALGFVAGDPASLAEQLKLIYKDENFRKGLISKGWDRLGDFSRGRATDTVWEGITRATGTPVAG